MLFFGDAQNQSLSESLASEFSTPLFFPDITVFPDGERRVRLNNTVVGQDVVFLKTSSITPNIDSFIIETAFLIDAIKRSGAEKIIGIIPYIPYSRADHVFRDGEAVPLEVVVHLLEKAGLSKIVFVDPHTIKMPEMFSIEVVNLSALGMFAGKIKEIGFHKDSSVIVSPDMGGLRRMEQLSEMLDGLPFVSIEKERNYASGEISVSKVHGEIKKTCFIVDDIISSGKTIVQAVEKAVEFGAEKVYVFATHPIFAGDAVSLLEHSNVEKVYITDSLPVPEAKKFEKLEILSLSHILSQAVSE
jgi:ribose-phosphate pyrophosphokinase